MSDCNDGKSWVNRDVQPPAERVALAARRPVVPDRSPQRPLNTGARFSMKAPVPSRMSAVLASTANSWVS